MDRVGFADRPRRFASSRPFRVSRPQTLYYPLPSHPHPELVTHSSRACGYPTSPSFPSFFFGSVRSLRLGGLSSVTLLPQVPASLLFFFFFGFLSVLRILTIFRLAAPWTSCAAGAALLALACSTAPEQLELLGPPWRIDLALHRPQPSVPLAPPVLAPDTDAPSRMESISPGQAMHCPSRRVGCSIMLPPGSFPSSPFLAAAPAPAPAAPAADRVPTSP